MAYVCGTRSTHVWYRYNGRSSTIADEGMSRVYVRVYVRVYCTRSHEPMYSRCTRRVHD
jgi:hypothetical protein